MGANSDDLVESELRLGWKVLTDNMLKVRDAGFLASHSKRERLLQTGKTTLLKTSMLYLKITCRNDYNREYQNARTNESKHTSLCLGESTGVHGKM